LQENYIFVGGIYELNRIPARSLKNAYDMNGIDRDPEAIDNLLGLHWLPAPRFPLLASRSP
jgi:hypothetical protein